MQKEIEKEEWEKRMNDLEEKNQYYKLKRKEKNELKKLHRRNTEIKFKKFEEKKREKKKKRN